MKNTVQKSSIVNEAVVKAKVGQFTMPSWALMITLIIALVIIKAFIYIKDSKRHNQ